ncbi:MAG: acetyl-CoA acetyltransferase [Deltaproteobacteria bacterium]|nr:acetyl-CoA acetyltransferase [Deltaproteobacteria bacterium]MBW1861276.1 acetyl-CoA acetyltransferase [Deltaproteobacteria bacterium]
MLESIKNKIAIVGMGCVKFGENFDMSIEDMIIDAAYEAYEDAGIESGDIQAAWFGNIWAGETGQILAAPLKLSYIPVTHTENACATGSEALRGACYAVASGACDVALALGVEKLKDTGYMGLPQTRPTATWSYRLTSQTPPAVFAMMATGYFAKHGLSHEEGKKLMAQIAVKNHHNGSLNPKAHFQREITLEKAINAPMIAYPLGLFDCCGVSDGAAAAIVTRADMAKSFRPDPIYIKAMQICQGPREGFMNPAYEFDHVEETRRGGVAAYEEAGVKNPREEISIAEVHDCFSITELTIMEDLGFSPIGRVKEDIDAGTFTLEGELPVNTDGGLKCFGHPIGATGLRMMYEVYKQLQEKAGPRQVKNPSLGLTHNQGGEPGAAVVSVVIAGNEL